MGPGAAVFQEVEMDKIEPLEWANVFDELIQKWINEHPETGKDLAEHLVVLINEYEKLRLEK